MKQLNIHNLRVSIDAHGSDPIAEAHNVIATLNKVLNTVDGQPALLFERNVTADYESDDDEE